MKKRTKYAAKMDFIQSLLTDIEAREVTAVKDCVAICIYEYINERLRETPNALSS